MATLGEGYRALGAGMSSQYQRDRDEMKKLMKLQQRQQLMTAALAPIAQGVGKAATDLISAPFKDAADNFYRRGAGKGLNAKIATFKANRAEALSRYGEIQKQGHRKYYGSLEEEALRLYKADMASKGFDETSAYYNEGLSALYADVQKEQDREWEEVKKEAQYYLAHPTAPKDIDAALAKYSPYAKNPMDWLYKTGKRIIKRQSQADYEQAALDKLSTHLGLDDATIAQVKELNQTASDYFFSPEVIKSNPIFQDEGFLAAQQSFKTNQEFRQRILTSGSGGEKALYLSLQKQTGELPSPEQFQYSVNQEFSKFLSATNFSDSKTSFRNRVVTGSLPPVLKDQIKSMNPNEQAAELNKIADGAYSTARQLVQDRYLRQRNTINLSDLQSFQFINEVEKTAAALINTATELDVLKEALPFGTDKGRITFGTDLEAQMVDNPNLTTLGGKQSSAESGGQRAKAVPPQPVDLTDSANDRVLDFVRNEFDSILGSDASPEEQLEAFQAVEKNAMINVVTAKGLPDDTVITFIYPKAMQQQLDSLENTGLSIGRRGYRGYRGQDRKTIEEQFREATEGVPQGTTRTRGQFRGQSEENIFSRFRRGMQEAALEERERKLAGPSEEELQRRRDYENRSSSEAFGDTEMGREMPPEGKARAAYRSNLREPFQNIGRVRSLLDSDDTPDSEPSSSVLAARQAYDANRREPFQNIDSLMNSGNIQETAKRALNAIGVRVEPKSPERVAEIMQQRAEAIKAYEAGKPLSTEEPAIIDSIIDFFIPGAEASPIIEEEAARPLTQIGAIASRQKQKEIDRWEGKKTIDVSGVVRGGKKMTISTEDPVAFIRNSDLTPTESIALYYTALKQHSDERPSAKTYAMKPLTQAMLWTYEAMPEEVKNLEKVFATRLQSQEMSENIQAIVGSEDSQSEINTYSTRVSKMSKPEKEAEFKRQLRIAKKVPTETDEDFARNAIEYLKLESIFGEDSSRNVSSGGRNGKVTVSDKVDEYYTNMLQFTTPDYDKQTQLYADLLLQLKSDPRPPSLLAQN